MLDNRGMCGRFTQTFPLDWIEAWLAIDEVDPAAAAVVTPRLAIVPSQPILVIQGDRPRRLTVARFGFESGGDGMGPRPFNARAETVASLPRFASAFVGARCVVPASGFYEWGAAPPRTKKPAFLVTPREDTDPLLLFAAVLQQDSRGTSCAIITVPANRTIAPVHDRMPALIERAAVGPWLVGETARAHGLLGSAPESRLDLRSVSLTPE